MILYVYDRGYSSDEILSLAMVLDCNDKDMPYVGRYTVFNKVIQCPLLNTPWQFETLLLLCEGRMAYFGAAGASVNYFRQRGHICPEHYNPGMLTQSHSISR